MPEGPSPPPDRCGHTYDVSTLNDVGAVSCWRPVWEGEDRCIWHASVDVKPRDELAEQALDCPERLDGIVLRRVSLNEIDWFEDCTLFGAEIRAVDLHDASLRNVDLRESTLEHVDARRADLTGANLEDTSLNVCDFRDACLEGVRLDQSAFTNVRISRETEFGDEIVYATELEQAENDERYIRTAEAAIWSYRQVRNLHQDNALPVEARQYYLAEKDMRRRVDWHESNYVQAVKAESARWTTGYGMNPWRVLGASVVIIVLSAVLYPLTGGIEESASAGGGDATNTWTLENPDDAPPWFVVFVFGKSLYFSTITFSTLGYGDIRPVGSIARTIAGVESLLGSLLMAVLVFVLTRRIS